MRRVLSKYTLLLFLFFIVVSYSMHANPLQANAGADRTVCPGFETLIGGSPAAQFGYPPYQYSWSPSTGLSSTTISNPIVSPTSLITYTLTVTDDSGYVATDVVIVEMSYIYYQNAGKDETICINQEVLLGGAGNAPAPNVTFAWQPSAGINDTTLPRPLAQPLVTTTYTLTINQSGCSTKVSTKTVTVLDLHVLAGDDQIINEGETTTLHATGAVNYFWYPTATLTYATTANPNAEPKDTTVYFVTGYDINFQCSDTDTMRVFVKKGNDIYFFNTFTPNADGENDTWYIGNIYKYPDNTLDIYTRNSKLVYHADSYLNTWDGKSFGIDLPAATYYYVLDLGEGSDKYHGTVTIIR